MIINADALTGLAQMNDRTVQTVVTSPPYYHLRRYGTPCHWPAVSYQPMAGLPEVHIPEWYGELGHEPDIFAYIGHLVAIMREVKRVLRDDGTVWFNIGDSYTGSGIIDPQKVTTSGMRMSPKGRGCMVQGLKHKDLMMIPSRIALALQAGGWYLRSQIIWHKPTATPESVTDRPTGDYEPVYLLAKSERYYYNAQAIAEPTARDYHVPRQFVQIGNADNPATRNARTVWTIPTEPSSHAHYALMPSNLAKRCILAGSRVGDTVLDPFGGGGTTAKAAYDLGREYITIEPNAEYIEEIMKKRLTTTVPMMLEGVR